MNARPNRRWLQFSLRTFLILVTLLAFWLGYISYHARNQRAAVARIEQLGGRVKYDWQMGSPTSSAQHNPPGWAWLRRLVGDEYFQDVVFVNLAETKVSNDDLRLVARLRRTKELFLSNTEISDDGLTSICGMSELRFIGLDKTNVTNKGILALPQPRNGCSIFLSDAGVDDSALSNLIHCRTLVLDGTPVTSQGINLLAGSSGLSTLSLKRTGVDDSAVSALVKITTLEWLDVTETRISGEGLLALWDALPQRHLEGELADFAGGFSLANASPKGASWKNRLSRLQGLNKEHKLKLLILPDPLITDGHLATL